MPAPVHSQSTKETDKQNQSQNAEDNGSAMLKPGIGLFHIQPLFDSISQLFCVWAQPLELERFPDRHPDNVVSAISGQ
jgi:hypothetical protein